MIYGAVKEQKLVLRAEAVADTIDYLTAKFTFMSQDWEGLTIYAHFKQGETNYSVQLVDGMITESDHLNLGKGEWEVYLHGNEYRNGNVIKRITTNICTLTVLPTGILNGDPFPEAEPSVVEQLIAHDEDHENRIDILEDIVDKEVKVGSIGGGLFLNATAQEIYDTYNHQGTNNLFFGPYRILRMRINQQDSLLEFWGIRRISDVSTSRIDISKFTAPLDSNTARRVGYTHAIPTWDEYEKLVNKGQIAEGNQGYVIGGDVYDALNNLPGIAQPDFAEDDPTAGDYIKNKPDMSLYALLSALAAVALSNDYRDLDNKPDIPDIPEGTNAKDILYWDATTSKYISGAITQVIPNGDEVSY